MRVEVDEFPEGLDGRDHTGYSVAAVECGLSQFAYGLPRAARESTEQFTVRRVRT